MPFKKLSLFELTELWNAIEAKSQQLRTASMSHNAVKVYKVLADLDTLQRQLRSHFAAVALEESAKTT